MNKSFRVGLTEVSFDIKKDQVDYGELERLLTETTSLQEALACLETIERGIWNNRKKKPPEAVAQTLQLMRLLKDKPFCKDAQGALTELIKNKSRFEGFEKETAAFIFSQIAFFIPLAIVAASESAIRTLTTRQPQIMFNLLNVMTNVGILLAFAFPVELVLVGYHVLHGRRKALKRKAFYEFCLSCLLSGT